MSISNFNLHYKAYKNYYKNISKKNIYYKYLVKGILKKTGGRNNKGFITAYNRGGGVKGLYRNICFEYFELFNKGLKRWIVDRIEYDNSRICNIFLLKSNLKLNLKNDSFKIKKNNIFYCYFFNTYYIYRLANDGVKKGDLICFFEKEVQYIAGQNQFAALRDIWTGANIFNIESIPFNGGKLVRSAGSKAKLLRKYIKYGLVLLPSGEKKLLLLSAFATLGIPSNSFYLFKRDYKAGNSRLKNRRPVVRGVAKNPIDHPHGGGEGKTSGGRHSVSRWGILTKGYVTKRKKIRKKKNMSRSKWKGVFLCYSLYKKYFLYRSKYNFIKIYTRSSMILTEFIGCHFSIYNGLKFMKLFVLEETVGHKFGEFSYTRKLRKFIHKEDNAKRKNKKKK